MSPSKNWMKNWYATLPSDEKDTLASASANQSGTVVEQAMARYDYLTVKYQLSEFINGRTLSARFTQIHTNNAVVIIVVSCTILALASVGAVMILRKRRYSK